MRGWCSASTRRSTATSPRSASRSWWSTFKKPVARGRPAQCRRAGLHQRGAARSRRHRHPHRADAEGQGQYDPRGRAALCRSAAGELDRACCPGLPQEVIDELARRAREAERQLHQQQATTTRSRSRRRSACGWPSQPTFMRYVFDLPDGVNVVPEQRRRQIDAQLRPADQMGSGRREASLPPTLKSIDADIDFDSVAVSFVLNGKPRCAASARTAASWSTSGSTGAKPKPAAARRAAAPTPSRRPQTPCRRSPPPRRQCRRCRRRRATRRHDRSLPAECRAGAATPQPSRLPAARRAARSAGSCRVRQPRRQPSTPAANAALRRSPAAAAASRRGCRSKRRHRRQPPSRCRAAAKAPPRAGRAAQPKPPPPNPNAPVVVESRIAAAMHAHRISFRGADAGRGVPPRRHAVAGVRQRRQHRSRRARHDAEQADPRGARSSAATTARPSCACKLARPQLAERADRRPGLDRRHRRQRHRCRPSRWSIARSDRRQEPRQHRHPVRRARRRFTRINDPDVGDQLMVVTALGAGARLPQGAGFRRAARAAVGARRGGAAARRRPHGASCRPTRSRSAGRTGLSLSADRDRPAAAGDQLSAPLTFDTQLWGFDRRPSSTSASPI